MSIEEAKICLSQMLDRVGVLDRKNQKILLDCNSIRAVNYHRTPAEEISTFKEQIKYYSGKYQNITYSDMKEFLDGSKTLDKQGLILSFDDGLMNNYTEALPILEDYGFTGYFFVSAGKIGQDGYMGYHELQNLLSRGHVIGCHTYTHHRMNQSDDTKTLQFEITDSQIELKKHLNTNIDIFCWCGGEESTYTAAAAKLIEEEYQYAFMTNSALIHAADSHFHLERTNVEARWPLQLAKFQLCGFMDTLYQNKRKRVEAVTADCNIPLK